MATFSLHHDLLGRRITRPDDESGSPPFVTKTSNMTPFHSAPPSPFKAPMDPSKIDPFGRKGEVSGLPGAVEEGVLEFESESKRVE